MNACFVCRCEEITVEHIQRVVAAGALTVNDVKRQTKAGMGLCQGAYCVATIAQLIAEQTGSDATAIAPMTSRPPARLITLDELSQLTE